MQKVQNNIRCVRPGPILRELLSLYWSLVISSNIRTPKVRSSAKHFVMTSVDSSVLEVEGLPSRSSSGYDSRPAWNLLYHSNTLVLDKHSSPYTLFNISNVSAAVSFNFTQNLIDALCPILKLSTLRSVRYKYK
jgi:hypothetical protein